MGNTRRGRGENALFHSEEKNAWIGRIELPAGPNGERRRKEIQRKSKADLIRELTRLQKQLERQGDIPSDNLTVAGWADYWMREVAVKTRRPKTVESYGSIIEGWIKPAIGNTRLNAVTPSTIRKALIAMNDAGRSSTYQRNAHSVMAAMFADAEREGRIPRNPVELVTAPRKAVTHLEVLTLEETIGLLDVFSETPDGALWATFLLTGARRGEVLGMEWDRITSEQSTHPVTGLPETHWAIDLSWQLQRLTRGLTLPAGFEYRHLDNGIYLTRPKTRSGWRIIPLLPPLLGIIERLRVAKPDNAHGLVFAMPDGDPIDPDYVSRTWPKILKAAGIDRDIRLHDARHGAADMYFAAGLDPDDIKAVLGHSSILTSRSYRSKANQERLRASLGKVYQSLER